MSIKNPVKVTNQIVNWFNVNYLKLGSAHSIIGLSGGISSFCAALLCKKSNIPITAIHVQFDQETSDLVEKFCAENNIKLIKINGEEILNGLEAKITGIDSNKKIFIYKKYLLFNFVNTIISSIANILNSSVLSSFDKNKINFVRSFNKLNDFSDLYPLGDLYKSEILELYKYLVNRMPVQQFPITKEIINQKSSDEEMGLTFTQEELEWADREDNKSSCFNGVGIIKYEGSPSNHLSRFWIGYNARQKEIISKLNRIEKEIKHKEPHLNICKLRNIDSLIT